MQEIPTGCLRQPFGIKNVRAFDYIPFTFNFKTLHLNTTLTILI